MDLRTPTKRRTEPDKGIDMAESTVRDPKMEQAFRLIINIGMAAHAFGATSLRVESYLARTAQALGLKGEFMATPKYIYFVIWQHDDLQQHTNFAATPASAFDMTRLAELSDLVKQIELGVVTVTEGSAALDGINIDTGHPPTYNKTIVGLGYALAGAGFAIMLSLSWFDVFLATLLSLIVYATVLQAAYWPGLEHRLETSSGFVASVLANLAALLAPGSDASMVTLCALVMLLPGFSLTLGIAELSAQRVVAGMQRLVSGLLTTFKLFLGAAAGALLVMRFATIPDPASPFDIPAIWIWVSALCLTSGIAIAFQVRPRDFGWVVLGGVLAYAGVLVGNQFGYWQGSFLGAITLGIYSSLYAWILGRPESIVMLTAIMVLVPGAGAYRALQAAAMAGAASGLTAEWQVFVNILAILAGVLVAFTIVPTTSYVRNKD
jgi:uncharacterized membrane protein YjjP (DUF1212 family)